jgi:iron complex transport system permease protein
MTFTGVHSVRQAARRRQGIITLFLLVVVAALAGAALAVGDYTLSLPDLAATLVGHGEGSDNFIVLRLRLPRVVMGILVGAAFAVSGALFQTLLRNPLASPDIIGISGGASVAAAFSILILGLGGAAVTGFAFSGALVIAVVIYVLAWRGGVNGYRFVLVGVGLAFMVQAMLGYLMTRGDVREVQQALVWIVGGLGGSNWSSIATVAITLAVLLVMVTILSARLRVLQLGDEVAAGLGVSVEATRLTLLVLAVGLVAVGTAFVGPLAFVAFVSAPIARRLNAAGGLALVSSALVGAALVLAADLAAQHLLPGELQVPAGILTGIVGAPYLLWLLATTTNGGGRGA